MVGGMCSMLPYDTGTCCYTFMYIFFFIASVHSFFSVLFLKSRIDKSTEWSTIPAPCVIFFNRCKNRGD